MKKAATLLAALMAIWFFCADVVRPSERGEEPLFPIRQDQKWGYIDETGQTAISPRFDDARPFAEGLALVKVGGKWGAIDRTGTVVIQPGAISVLSSRLPASPMVLS